MIWMRCQYNNQAEYQQLVDLAATLNLYPSKVKVKDFYSVVQFKPAKTAKKTDDKKER